jgi:hypothetical protein
MLFRTLSWLVALSSLCCAQEIVWSRDGVSGQHKFEFAMGAVPIGDVDGDGWEDAVVIVSGIPSFATELWLLSGRDGRTLRRRPQIAPLEYFSVVARTGDMNGDGAPDYAFTTSPQAPPYEPLVEVASGVDDRPILRIRGESASFAFGSALLGDLDLDGDGKPDLIVSEPVHPTLRYHAYDNSGTELYTIPRQPDLEFYRNPLTVARLADLDGDGANEWMAGGGKTVAPNGHGAIVFSGRTGAIHLRAFNTSLPFEQIGTTVLATGDLDGDGVPDILAASNFCGAAVTFSGRDGHELSLWQNQSAVSGIGIADLDRDGVDDFLLGLPTLFVLGTGSGVVVARSGRDGGELFRIIGGGNLGVRLDLLRGPDDGSFPMFLAPMPTALFDDGRVRLYRATPRTVVPSAAPRCVGGMPAPAEIGLRDLAASGRRGVRVHLSDAPPGVGAWLFLGLSNTTWNGVPLPYDLSFLGLPAGCALHTSIDAFAVRTTGTSGLDAGFAFVDIPVDLSALGTRIWAQWAVFGPGNTWPGGLTRPLSWQLAL